jgi:hypothetical protein
LPEAVALHHPSSVSLEKAVAGVMDASAISGTLAYAEKVNAMKATMSRKFLKNDIGIVTF